MNRYPLWKYITIAIALVLGFVYTLPNFFGESPAVQVSSAKVTIKVDAKAQARVEEALKAAGITHDGIQLDFNGVKTRLKDTATAATVMPASRSARASGRRYRRSESNAGTLR